MTISLKISIAIIAIMSMSCKKVDVCVRCTATKSSTGEIAQESSGCAEEEVLARDEAYLGIDNFYILESIDSNYVIKCKTQL